MAERNHDLNPVVHRPKLREDLHRPVGSPQPREIKSQKAQLKSTHRHGANKGVKLGMAAKIGLKEDE